MECMNCKGRMVWLHLVWTGMGNTSLGMPLRRGCGCARNAQSSFLESRRKKKEVEAGWTINLRDPVLIEEVRQKHR